MQRSSEQQCLQRLQPVSKEGSELNDFCRATSPAMRVCASSAKHELYRAEATSSAEAPQRCCWSRSMVC